MNRRLTTETKRLLDKYNLRPKKKFGQNFLIDEKVIHGILKAAELGPGDTVVEIGPGLGSLTEHLVRRSGQVLAIEIDSQLIPLLKEKMNSRGGHGGDTGTGPVSPFCCGKSRRDRGPVPVSLPSREYHRHGRTCNWLFHILIMNIEDSFVASETE